MPYEFKFQTSTALILHWKLVVMYTKNFPDSKNQIFKKFIALFQSIFAHSVQDKRCWNGKPFPKQKERNSVNSENVLVVLLLYIYYSCQRLLWDIVHSIVNVTPSAIFRYISGKKGLSSSIQGPPKPNLTLEQNMKMCLVFFRWRILYCMGWLPIIAHHFGSTTSPCLKNIIWLGKYF